MLGKSGTSSHLLEPLTSIPKKGTNIKKKKKKKNNIFEILIKSSLLIDEKKIKKNTPNIIKKRCFKKK